MEDDGFMGVAESVEGDSEVLVMSLLVEDFIVDGKVMPVCSPVVLTAVVVDSEVGGEVGVCPGVVIPVAVVAADFPSVVVVAVAVAEVRGDSIVCVADVNCVSSRVVDAIFVLEGDMIVVVAGPVLLTDVEDGSTVAD